MADNKNNTPPKPFRVEVDYERYAHMLDDPDLSETEKQDFLQAMWSIAVAFVDLGFEIHTSHAVCGKVTESPANPTVSGSDLVYSKHRNLMEDFITAHAAKEAET